MIYLVTGAPGNGKTLYTLTWVKEWAEKDGREVFYNGIPDLKLPWAELDDPAQWHNVPPGAIVVLDEAQRAFRPRAPGARVPEHVERLETHRHQGIDLVLITQHPKLIDNNARRLVGCHRHVVRPFGMSRATVHEWGEVRETCEQPGGRADSIAKPFAYPENTMALYKSAEVHTHKRRIPARVYFLLALPLLLAAISYYGYQWWRQSAVSGKVPDQVATGKISPSPEAIKAAQAPQATPAATLEEYIAARTPRLEGLAYTAPVYDDLTKPDSVPWPSMCMASETKCRCYTDQATPLKMPDTLCRSIAKDGLYKPFGKALSQQAAGGAGKAAPAAAPPPVGVPIKRATS